MEQLISIRGKRLFLDIRGPEDAPVLLYLHGGPGQGSHEFMAFQGDRLSRDIRVIALDQRGVLRSDPLAEGEPFGLSDLLVDCEAVREHLEIPRWSVLGQSFGGYVALLYAVTYPDAVERLLFENPTWDLGMTSRSVLRKTAGILSAAGDAAAAARCLAVADHEQGTQETWAQFMAVITALEGLPSEVYFHQPAAASRFAEAESAAPFPPAWRERCLRHRQSLFEEGSVWASLVPRFPEVRCPSLLLKGVHDAIPSEAEVQDYLRLCPGARMVRFAESAHFVQLEEAERYADIVTAFLTET